MGVRIKSLMAAAHAAGYAMAPEDMYPDDSLAMPTPQVPVRSTSTALVPLTHVPVSPAAAPGLLAQARSIAGRYVGTGWMAMPRLTA